MIIRCLLAALGFVWSIDAHSEQKSEAKTIRAGDWSYVSAYGGAMPWVVKPANARVTIQGKKIGIEVLDQQQQVIEKIAGTIVKNKIQAKRLVMFSDVAEEPVTGGYKRYLDGGTVYEVIMLTSDFSLLGVNRISKK